MRILHVIPTIDPNAGGPALICTKLAIAQARLGHDVTILAYEPPPAGRERILAENGRTAGFDRLTLRNLPPITLRERVTGRHARAAAGRLVPNADVVHLHGLWETALLHAATAARRHGKPYLILLNGMLMPWAMARGVIHKQIALRLGWHRALAHCVPHFGSDDEAAAFRALGFHNSGVVIPNGAFPDEYADLPPAGTFRAAHPELADHPYVLFVGRLHQQKGIDLLLAAFDRVAQRHPTVRLVIAGPDYGVDIESHSGRSPPRRGGSAGPTAGPWASRLLRLGPIYGRDKLAALRDAACFCLPSRHEGFSLAVLEALACGVPVVISTECHFPEVATAAAGVVTSLDPAAIADGLLAVLADPSFRARATPFIAERYNWMTVAAATVDAYRGRVGRASDA